MQWISLRRVAIALILSGIMFRPDNAWSVEADNLTHLESADPFYPSRTFPKLTTPQWAGERGVDVVIVLAIDDLGISPRHHAAHYEFYLRPILERLKKIDGRAPVSIITNRLNPDEPQLQSWLKEGVTLECHSFDHPCPILSKGDFALAQRRYNECLEQLSSVPGNSPVAFRVPCCDGMNNPSPRFYAEIFNSRTTDGRFLTIDSSVLMALTSEDKELPRDLVETADGKTRFLKYVPRDFVNYIRDYPYPYVLGRLCWQFPCIMPSDYQAHLINKPYNPKTVADWKAALDAVAIKKGLFTMVFHPHTAPHGWVRSEQMVELINYIDKKYGKRALFLNFREAQQRLDKHLLAGQPLRAANGQDNGVRLLDLDNDGFLDVVIGNEHVQQSRVWNPERRTWEVADFPTRLVEIDAQGNRLDAGVRFGKWDNDGRVGALVRNETASGVWRFDGKKWIENSTDLEGLSIAAQPVWTSRGGQDCGVRLRDVDHDGRCELLVSNPQQQAIFGWSVEEKGWRKLPFALPDGVRLVDKEGRDAGLRFVDLNDDDQADLVFSDERGYAVHVFDSARTGWQHVRSGRRGDPNALPMIVRGGTNNGVWFHSGAMYVQNEHVSGGYFSRHMFSELISEEK